MSSARRREAEHVLRLCRNDHLRAYELVERQVSRLLVRAQVVVSICVVVIAATALSGRAIAATTQAARMLVYAGTLVTLLAALVTIAFGLRMRWLSQEIDDEPIVTVLRILEVRDRNALSQRWAVSLFAAGLLLHCAALVQYVLSARP